MTGWTYVIAGLAGVGALIATATLASAPPLAALATARPAGHSADRDDMGRDADRRDADRDREDGREDDR